MKIQPSVLAIKGRILPAPSVEYDGATFKPDFGSWNLKEKRRFATGAGIKRWTCLQIQIAGKDRPVAGLDGFVLGLQKVYESTICGSARSHQSVTLKGTSPEYLFDTLDRFFGKVREKDIDTLLVILPDKRQTLFACIKYLADVKHGMRTICIEASTLQKHIKESWYAATIAQKLNIRGGGVNQRLAESELETLLVQPTMIVGIDVIKPFPRGDINTATSLIGVVASMDRDCAQWPASVRQQENPDKVDHDLQEMMTERLNLWKKANGKLPSRLLIYRNGVTSSHDTVMAKEAKSISDALSSTYSRQALPKVTFMTISKSHHTRFYPADRKAADGQTGNPKAGTVFDRDITGTGPWDFYLQSHPGTPKSGTVCPAHYVVVKDDMGLGADGVQKLVSLHLLTETSFTFNMPSTDSRCQ